MIKNLFLALCAASLVGTAFAEFTLTQEEPGYGPWTLTGEGSYNELLDKLTTSGVDTSDAINFGIKDGAKVVITFGDDDSKYLPQVNTIKFMNADLRFNALETLIPAGSEGQTEYDPGPALIDFDYDFIQGTYTFGDLNVSIAQVALKDWLKGQEALDHMANFPLIKDAAIIQHQEGANLKLQLVGDQGDIGYGDVFVYDEHHQYTNIGIVWDEGQLQKNQIALLYVPGGIMEEWGGGGFNVLALGENYTPVPEPATGTLSLLALAGLAARRRRK